MTETTARQGVLDAAIEATVTDRNASYGDPEDNFADIARLWTAYDGRPYSRMDVAHMMTLLKIARCRTSPLLEDHYIDAAGYQACGYEAAVADRVRPLEGTDND